MKDYIGRRSLKDLLVDKHILTLQNVKTVVLDEADMLLDLGFFADIESIFALLNKDQDKE